MKIAITGANGFIGSNLANFFFGSDHDVLALVRPKADTSLLDPNISIIRTDYSDSKKLDGLISEADVVIHNASRTRTHTFEEMLLANVGVTRRVIEAVNISQKCSRFVYISSQAASHPSQGLEEVSEDEPSLPVDWYGRTKVLAERIIKAECLIPWTIIRPVSVYGEGERDFLNLFRAFKSGLNIRISDRKRHVNLIHITELCAFIELCIHKNEAERQIFFASDGKIYPQSDFALLIQQLLNVKTRELHVPVKLAKAVFHAGDIFEKITRKSTLINTQKLRVVESDWLCSSEKARQLLGWDPKPDLETKLRQTLEWYKQKGWL
jgi:nucleoside-diphosphate-sugar epimerase